MRIIRLLCFRLSRLRQAVCGWWHRATASMHQGRLDWPDSACASAPLRSDGRGAVLIGDCVVIGDSDSHRTDPSARWSGSDEAHPVSIQRNVWSGSRVLVLKGVTIGDNTVAAAGSVVSKSLPANVVRKFD